MLFELIFLGLLVIVSAFFSCTETAFMAVSRLKAETLAKQNVPGSGTLLRLKEKPRQFIITVLIGNCLVNTGASAIATVLAITYFGESGVGIATGIMTFMLLTFGEIIPKSFATVHAEKIILPLARPSMITIRVFYPLVFMFEGMTNAVLHGFGGHKKTPLFSESELRTLVEVGVKENRLEQTDKDLIEGVLEFKQTIVKEIMTPRRRMFCLDENMPVQEALKDINKREHTRIPVYSGTKERIVGIIYLKDVLAAIAEDKGNILLKQFAKKPVFVDENKHISTVFKEMKGRHVHIAIVVNKKMEVKGLVTLEDIIEEIVGDIFDEKDISPTLMKRISKTLVIVHGKTDINDINTFFNIRLPSTETVATLDQFLQTLKKKEWQEGMKIRWNDLTFTIREVEENHPVKVFIEKK